MIYLCDRKHCNEFNRLGTFSGCEFRLNLADKVVVNNPLSTYVMERVYNAGTAWPLAVR